MVMQIGIKEEIDYKSVQYYEKYYDILRTPDFNDTSRLLKPNHGIHTIGASHNKKCWFCGKDESETKFTEIAHVFPECIGNSVLASYFECDECNQFFGNTLENEYAKFFNFYHSIMQIKGKKGKSKCCYRIPCDKRTDACNKNCVEISIKNGMPYIGKCVEVGEKYVRINENSIQISKPIGRYCPIAVFKTIVKMAITVMPSEELPLFTNTIEWLLQKEHSNIFNKQLLIKFKMIPGFDVTKYPHYCLYRRKKTVWGKPYMLFNITYGCFSLLIEIPRDSDCSSNSDFLSLPFPPIPFYTSTEGIWDLSNSSSLENFMQSITLNFEERKTLPPNSIL